jgi:hypothetical protein
MSETLIPGQKPASRDDDTHQCRFSTGEELVVIEERNDCEFVTVEMRCGECKQVWRMDLRVVGLRMMGSAFTPGTKAPAN